MTLTISEWLFWLAAGLGAIVTGLVVFLLCPPRRRGGTTPDSALNTRTVELEREAVSRATSRLLEAEERLRAMGDIPDATERSHALAGALRREMRGGHSNWTGVLAMYVALALILCGFAMLMSGCVHPAAPVFQASVPEMHEPELTVDFDAVDACPRVEPLIPGEPAPYVTDGLATCRAQVLPEQLAAELLHARVQADYWQDRAEICHQYRELDRTYCEAVAAQRAEDAMILRRQVTAHQVLLPVAVALSVVVGFLARGAAP